MSLKTKDPFEKSLHALLGAALKKAPQAEVYAEKGEESTVTFTTDRLKSGKTSSFEGVGLRVIKDERVGFSSSQGRVNAGELCRRALNSSSFGEAATFSFPEDARDVDAVHVNPQTDAFTFGHAVKLGREAVRRLKSCGSDVHVDVSVSKEEKYVYLLNSRGLRKRLRRVTFGFFVAAVVAGKTGLLNVYEGTGGTNSEFSVHALADKIIGKIKDAKKEVFLPTKKMTAVFTPKACFSFLEPFKLAVNGKTVQKGISPLCGRVGEKLASPRLTFYDDPTLQEGLHVTPFDGEGSATGRTILLEKGVLKSYLLDLKTASKLKLSSTGSAVRSFNSLPHPGATHFVVEKGDISFKNMISKTKEGVLVDQLIGWAANPLAGEFSANVELGFSVKDGEICGRVKDVMVSGNIYECLSESRVLGISRERELVFGSTLCPYLWLDGMSFSGTE